MLEPRFFFEFTIALRQRIEAVFQQHRSLFVVDDGLAGIRFEAPAQEQRASDNKQDQDPIHFHWVILLLIITSGR